MEFRSFIQVTRSDTWDKWAMRIFKDHLGQMIPECEAWNGDGGERGDNGA